MKLNRHSFQTSFRINWFSRVWFIFVMFEKKRAANWMRVTAKTMWGSMLKWLPISVYTVEPMNRQCFIQALCLDTTFKLIIESTSESETRDTSKTSFHFPHIRRATIHLSAIRSVSFFFQGCHYVRVVKTLLILANDTISSGLRSTRVNTSNAVLVERDRSTLTKHTHKTRVLNSVLTHISLIGIENFSIGTFSTPRRLLVSVAVRIRTMARYP